MQRDGAAPIKLFYLYSHRDEELRNELAEHLFPLQRAALIEVWHDREMLPGDTVDEEIARKLRTADLVLVLVSPSFIKSEYCWDNEEAIERHERGEARVVPVVLRPCQWQLTPLKHLLAMPTDGRAVINWPNRDTAFNDVAQGITKLAKPMRQKGSKAADPATAGAKPAAAGTITPAPSTPAPPPAHQASADAGPSRSLRETETTPAEGSLSRRERDGVREPSDFVVFRDVDAEWCPEMVVIPAGSFLMGSPPDEPERSDDEGPQHRVTLGYRFAIGWYAVTFEEYDHFCEVPGVCGRCTAMCANGGGRLARQLLGRADLDGWRRTKFRLQPRLPRGSWYNYPWGLHSAYRHGYVPDYRCNDRGFRVARTLY